MSLSNNTLRSAGKLVGSRRITATHPYIRTFATAATRESEKQAATEHDPSPKELEEALDKRSRPNDKAKENMSVAEKDAAMMNAWKERQGSLANTEFEGGQVEGGYRRNVKANIFRYI